MILWKITGSSGNHLNILKVKVLGAKQWVIDYCTSLDCKGEESRVEYTRDKGGKD